MGLAGSEALILNELTRRAHRVAYGRPAGKVDGGAVHAIHVMAQSNSACHSIDKQITRAFIRTTLKDDRKTTNVWFINQATNTIIHGVCSARMAPACPAALAYGCRAGR